MRKRFSLFCWNIHSCVGRDGKCEPDRVRHALASVDFDVYCLQEVGWQLHRGTRDFDPAMPRFVTAFLAQYFSVR